MLKIQIFKKKTRKIYRNVFGIHCKTFRSQIGNKERKTLEKKYFFLEFDLGLGCFYHFCQIFLIFGFVSFSLST